jgi:polyisoprenoid-binding protein YceI
MTFKSTEIKAVSEDRYTLTGDLTIKGNTKPVTFNVVKYGEFNDPMMGHRIAYSAEAKINRRDYGLTFDMMLDGRLIVSTEIQINLEGEFIEVDEEKEAETASA